MTIDAYLSVLERLLPRIARLRALPEIAEHLRDAAARHRSAGASPFEAEAAATREFGPVEDVARRLGAELAVRETRIAAALALGAVAFFVFPFYVVPENTLPPPTWVEKPPEVQVLQQAALGLWILSGALAVVSTALAWTRWLRLAPLASLGATLAMTASISVLGAVVWRWFEHTPATPNWALAAPFALACLVVCAAGALWARASGRRLVD